MSYEVKLEVFEGPLDLLLHLIHRNEVSITDIPIAMITGQYLDAVELMKSLNLDVAGEYLVMAAYLTHIKSLMLLPASDDPDIEPDGHDPRQDLVAHLLEYKRYKEAAQNLSAMPILERDVFLREPGEESPELPRSHQPLKVSLADLLAAFRGVLERTTRMDLLEVEPDRLLVKDKINELLGLLRENEWLTFDSLFQTDSTRLHVVTTFLALLELVKLQLVRAYQDSPYGTILISGTAAISSEESS
ncbi:MAG: segregation/condensation protein A [Thermodesulfobacteriota bacterium]